MTEEEYRAVMDELKAERLAHAAKGSSWKKHKYLRIENGRYIYPEDDAKLRDSSTARNYGPGNGSNKTSPKGEERDKQAMEDLLKKAAKVSGEKTSIVNEKNTNLVADAARTEAAKEYANDLTDKAVAIGLDYLHGNKDANFDFYKELKKLIDSKKVQLTDKGEDEVERMVMIQMFRRMDEEIKNNPDEYTPEMIAEYKEARKECEEYYNMNTPFKDRSAEIKNFEKSQKVKHSFDSREAFYAAVYDYKQSHKR